MSTLRRLLVPRDVPRSSRDRTRAWGVALPLAGVAALALGACGDGPRAVDAQVAPSAQSAEVSIRFDVSPGRPSTVQVLAFRATTTATLPAAGTPTDWQPDVLGIVDPLAATSPEQGCALRDIDLATTALMIRGGSIELQELTGVGVGLGTAGESLPAAEALLRPFPRLYPDVATVVGGVVSETGPQRIAALPEHVTLLTADSELPVATLAVPAAPKLLALNGTAVDPTSATSATAPTPQLDARDGVAITVAGGAGGRLELRPFGATIAAACAIPTTAPPEAVVTIPRAFIAQLARAMGGPSGAPFSASIELARRAVLRPSLAAAGARVSVEVRSAVPVELRP
jgi:hypothetical protein